MGGSLLEGGADVFKCHHCWGGGVERTPPPPHGTERGGVPKKGMDEWGRQ